ncbi:hypothetical protein Ddye_012207 [Dipteronia dyeriana]|uniref:Reverse transcriptase zinc-binding domain-containing protein n=1 Tax=Dipteronia dyeriana TaxID=168575 RepID=A0AAD9X3X4_9ROSI|nr:hypothetical protein Ddye_012207 [Dipteronia dyeriana]
MTIIYQPKFDRNSTVDQLLSPSGGWNIQMLLQNFSQYDVDGILKILVGLEGSEDRRVWHFEKNGVYSVRSGYWLGCRLMTNQHQSNSYVVREWWRKLWKLEIPSKIKVFIWKTCYDWVPTKLNLRSRGINCDDKCPVCYKHKESTLHAFWECPKLKYARRLWLPRSKLRKVWGIRNEWVHKGKKGEVCEAVWWSRNYVDELHRASCKLSTDSRKNEGDRWRPPEQGKLKINCDAFLDRSRRRIGVSSIIRDASGRVMACSSQLCDANFDLVTSKTLAVCKGTTFSRDCGLKVDVVEIDLAVVINCIVKGGYENSRYGSILDVIAATAHDLCNMVFKCVSKVANRVACALAYEAIGILEDGFWMEEAPAGISSLVLDDQLT